MKTQQRTGAWVFAAIVLAIVVGALAYLTLISPELDKATAASEEAQIARDANDLTEIQIQQMKALEQEVPDWREQIAKISLDMPPRVAQPSLERLVADSLATAGLPLVDFTTGRPEAIDPLAAAGTEPPTIAEPATTDGTAATPSPSPSPSATAAADADETSTDGTTGGAAGDTGATPVVEAPFDGLLAMPVSITTEGDPVRVLNFIKSMETQLTRFYTVTGFTIAKAAPAEESPGRPALTEDQWTVTITGMVFSLLDDTRSFVADDDTDLPEYVPGSPVDNAFRPLPGTEESAAN
ncbi:hypothetical protein Lsed01_00278 [Demequina sediminis]|uniref:Pilus assembly protein PilO n=1 Tax=Demequina sediminis TaxID=1930058 RepID=A0ABP9WDE9_9MICO